MTDDLNKVNMSDLSKSEQQECRDRDAKDDLNKEWAELEGKKYYDGPRTIGKPNDNEIEPLPDWTEPNRFFAEVVPRIQELCGYTFQHKLEIYFDYVGTIIHCGIFRPDDNFGKKLLAECSGKSEGIAGLKAAIQARKEIGK